MVKIAALNAGVMRSLLLNKELTSHRLQSVMNGLRAWYDELPMEIRLESLFQRETRIRHSGCHVHLLHLRGMMLCYGPIIAQLARNQCEHSNNIAIRKLLDHCEEALHAAMTSSWILHLLFDQRSMLNCRWLIMYE